jgi:hypothetical protein
VEPNDLARPATDGGVPNSDGGNADSASGDSLVVAFDGAPVNGTVKSCGYSQDATYRTMDCVLDLADGNTVTVSYLSAAGSGFAPTGPVSFPRQDDVLVTVQMIETGTIPYRTVEDVPWSGSGALTLTATGEGGRYAGTAKGTFTRDNPFSSRPTPGPIAFTISWSAKR